MKLLSKSAVDKAKAADRHREVVEGIKLAKRVDALREIAVHEETSLQEFRRKTLEQITKDLAQIQTTKEKLVSEVTSLELRKQEALRTLDAERQAVEEGARDVMSRAEALSVTERNAQERDGSLDHREQAITTHEARANDMHKRAQDLLAESSTLKEAAEQKHRLAEEIRYKATLDADVLIANAKQRETWVTNRETVAATKEEYLRTKEIALAKEWSKLQDREAILERNIIRSKK